MAALAAELQCSHLGQAQIATTSYCGSASGNDRIFSRVGFTSRFCGNRSRFEAIRLVSSMSTGRWLPLTQCGEWRVSRERNLGGELGQQEFSGKVGTTRRSVAVHVSSVVGGLEAPKPTYVPLEPITGEASFDQVLSEAAERNQPVVIDWLANWCRKCIYLKPKLEKLAAEYYPDIKFYFVDVNAVPQAVVKRAEVTKMPTVQIWKDGKKLAEVIGGNKTWMVMDEVREMIKNKN